jgi:CRISPR/Cas system-associated exonuclease Cas4 (RecB family)
MRLSYSQYRTFIQCPRLYHYQAIKKEPPEKPSSYFSLYGKLIEAFFKKYTNVYTKQGVVLDNDKIRAILKSLWGYILESNYVDWSDPWVRDTSDQIYENVYNDVLMNIKEFSFWKEAKSEVSFEVLLKKSQDILTCRMDFIWRKPDGTVEILDGKGTNKMDTSVDIEQLLFYALMYLLRNKRIPDKIGFLYYKYHLIKYVDFDMGSVMEFKDKLALVKKAISETTVFEPKVGLSKQCKWCAYRFGCDAFNAKKDANAEKKKSNIAEVYSGDIISL